MTGQIPVTIVSGSLGAGKTTLLNHLLETADRRLAVLVNDMGAVNVDAELLEGRDDLARDGVAELSNGCICCELQDDLEAEVRRLAGRYDFDHLVVESSGISEPAPVAKRFTTGSAAAARYDVDALVTVVDASLLAETFAGERIERATAPDDADRPLSDLLVEQIEISNVVLLNKCDLVEPDELDRLEAMIAALQPDAEVIRTVFSEVDTDRLLGRGLFDPRELGELAGWQRALHHDRGGDDAVEEDGERERHQHHEDDTRHQRDESHEGRDDHDRTHGHDDHDRSDEQPGHNHGHDHDHDHRGPEAVYGVSSITYRRRRPFHPDRFVAALEDLPPSVVRSKGRCWLAGNDDTVFQLSQAGRSVALEVEGRWVASRPESQRELYRLNHPDEPWDDEHGDRRTELVFIGTDFDADDLETRLDRCLVDPDASVDAAAELPAEDGERVVLRE